MTVLYGPYSVDNVTPERHSEKLGVMLMAKEVDVDGQEVM